MDQNQKLNLPSVNRVQFERNTIDTAVCEVRFPTLLDIEQREPRELQRALRKRFPHFQTQRLVQSEADSDGPRVRYLFESRKHESKVVLHASSIAVETNSYKNFESFSESLIHVVNSALPLIDSDFFTRVGLRYINKVSIDDGVIDGWVNADLVAPIDTGVLGTLEKYIQEIRGYSECGRYTFRHGIAETNESKSLEYFFDFDFYETNVEASDLQRLATNFNTEIFRFFLWAVGDKVRNKLGTASSKERMG